MRRLIRVDVDSGQHAVRDIQVADSCHFLVGPRDRVRLESMHVDNMIHFSMLTAST